MKIVAISDLHGHLPQTPDCDILLIAGDICPTSDHTIAYQRHWLRNKFARWLDRQPAKHKVGVLGNHDLVGEREPQTGYMLPWHYLQDSMVEIMGLKIYGLPWQKRFCDWAFNLDEQDLAKKYDAIPQCDVIVSHGPPFGLGDRAPRSEPPGYEDTGCPAFTRRIGEIKPKLVVFGHIHEGAGRWEYEGTTLANVTHLDANYKPVYPAHEFEIAI